MSGPARSGWLAALICAVALAAVRISLLPLYTDFSSGFTHDSAYIAIVARNLIHGKGWVNDASWLVFLHPARLPMPYRNANPLYPLSSAVMTKALSLPVARAGVLIAALASAILLLSVFFLVSYFLKRPAAAVAIAVAVAVFPGLWEDSLYMIPDALCLALLVAALACFVRAERTPYAVAAGVLFSAAWLTRSTAALVAPALLVYAFMAWNRRIAILRLATIAAVALVVASPWLVYSAHIWGSPFGSDGSYAIFQDFYAQAHGGSSDRFWHSPDPPLPPNAGAILMHALKGIPTVVRVWLRAGWEDQHIPRAVFVIALVCVAIAFRNRWRNPALIASAIFAVTQIAVFAVKADTVETRYLAPLTALAVIWLASGIAASRYRALVATACAICAVYIVIQDAALFRQATTPTTAAQWRSDRRTLSATIAHADPVIVADPYFYTYDTGAQSLSIPDSDDAYLIRYMDEYHSRWIMLTNDEIRFWKPQWQNQLPAWLRVRARFDEGILLERQPS
jgi:4-amino-4-deoxy-L-arabinose transferase-like glycosyltransferase